MSNITTPFGERPTSITVSEPPDRRAAEWGLASVVLGGLLVVTSPIILIVNILMAALGPRSLGMSADEIKLGTFGFFTVLVLLLALGLTGLVFGGVSLSHARSRNQTVALGLAGLLVCAVGFLALLIVGIDSAFVLVGFNQGGLR